MKDVSSLSSSAFLSTSSPSSDYHHVVVFASHSSCCWNGAEPGAWPPVTPPDTIQKQHHSAVTKVNPSSFSLVTSLDDEDDCWVWTPPAISLKSLHEQRQDWSSSSSSCAAAAELDTEHRHADIRHDWNNPAFHSVPVPMTTTTTISFAKPSSLMLDDCEMGEQVGEAVFNRALVGSV